MSAAKQNILVARHIVCFYGAKVSIFYINTWVPISDPLYLRSEELPTLQTLKRKYRKYRVSKYKFLRIISTTSKNNFVYFFLTFSFTDLL